MPEQIWLTHGDQKAEWGTALKRNGQETDVVAKVISLGPTKHTQKCAAPILLVAAKPIKVIQSRLTFTATVRSVHG